MHTASIDLLLEYDVTQPAHFLFNVEAAFDSCHRVVSERLSIAPSVKVRTFTDERCGNRFVRLDAPKGLLTLSYHADVELMPTPVPLYLERFVLSRSVSCRRSARPITQTPALPPRTALGGHPCRLCRR